MNNREELKNPTIEKLCLYCQTKPNPYIYFGFNKAVDFNNFLAKFIRKVLELEVSQQDAIAVLKLHLDDSRITKIQDKTYLEVMGLGEKKYAVKNPNTLSLAKICQDCFTHEHISALRKGYDVGFEKIDEILNNVVAKIGGGVASQPFEYLSTYYLNNQTKIMTNTDFQMTYAQLKKQLKEQENQKEKEKMAQLENAKIHSFLTPNQTQAIFGSDFIKNSHETINHLTKAFKTTTQPSTSQRKSSLNIAEVYQQLGLPIPSTALETQKTTNGLQDNFLFTTEEAQGIFSDIEVADILYSNDISLQDTTIANEKVSKNDASQPKTPFQTENGKPDINALLQFYSINQPAKPNAAPSVEPYREQSEQPNKRYKRN